MMNNIAGQAILETGLVPAAMYVLVKLLRAFVKNLKDLEAVHKNTITVLITWNLNESQK